MGALKKGKPIERWGRKATGLTTAIVHDSGVASDEIKSLPMYAERCRRVPYLFSSQLPPMARVHGLTAIGVGSSIELGSVTMSNLRKNLRAGLGVAGLVGLIMALAHYEEDGSYNIGNVNMTAQQKEGGYDPGQL